MSVRFCINSKPTPVSNLEIDTLNKGELFLKGNNGCTVILVHGLTGTPNEMKFLANFLNKMGYSVICPRLVNHGEPLDILKHTKWQDFYQSVRESFIKLNETEELIFVSGLSMGALLALLLAEEFKDRIAGVSCLSPTLFYDGWNMPWYRCFLPLLYVTGLRRFFYFKEDPPYGIKNNAIRRRVHEYYNQASMYDIENVTQYGYPYVPVDLLYQLHLLVKFLIKKLANIEAPVQLIQARDDDMTSVKNSQYIYSRIKSEKKEIVLLTDSYHVITADNERAKVAHNMEDFFDSIRVTFKENLEEYKMANR